MYVDLAPKIPTSPHGAESIQKQRGDGAAKEKVHLILKVLCATHPYDQSCLSQVVAICLFQSLRTFHQELIAIVTEKLPSLEFDFEDEEKMADLLKCWSREVCSPCML